MNSVDKFKLYLKERLNVNLLENEVGFITYEIGQNECYIRDIYILPEFRMLKAGRELTEQMVNIAKESGCTILSGSVYVKAIGADSSIKLLQNYGMKVFSANDDLIIFKKEI